MSDINFKLDFIGIGATKSATTWIYECLKEHPEICLSNEKDTLFFTEKNFYKGLNFYKSFFFTCHANTKIGEFSTAYLDNPISYKLIKECYPNIKIIVCLRNPITRTYSVFNHLKFDGKNPYKNFDEALKNDSEKFTKSGLYYQQLLKYYENFPSKNILVLLYADIKKNPVNFIQNIYKFINVDSNFIPKKINTIINPTKAKLSKSYIFFHHNLIQPLKNTSLGKKISYSSFVRNLYYKFVENPAAKNNDFMPPFSNWTKNELKKIYSDDIHKLSKLINKNLDFWLQ